MQRHARQNHQLSIPDSKVYWSPVKVQQWVPSGKGVKYWIVRVGPDVSSGSVDGVEDGVKEKQWAYRILESEPERLQDGDQGRVGNNADDTTPWLLYTKWHETFAGKSLALIVGARYNNLDQDPRLQSMFPDWSSRRTKLISSEFDKVVIRAVSTLDSTSNSFCHWVQRWLARRETRDSSRLARSWRDE
jgi:hypothetical protein